MPSYVQSSTPIMISWPTETSSGRCDRWWMSGTRTWLNNSLLHGSHVWTREGAHGPTNTHGQDGCLCPESHIHLAMNTILCVVLPWVLCGGWSLWEGKMLLMQWSIQNQNTTTMETLWVYCCEFWNPFLQEALLLCWIADSVY